MLATGFEDDVGGFLWVRWGGWSRLFAMDKAWLTVWTVMLDPIVGGILLPQSLGRLYAQSTDRLFFRPVVGIRGGCLGILGVGIEKLCSAFGGSF